RGDLGEFESLHEYAHGDDPRRIDWKATAKRRTTMVRRYQDERSQNLVLVVDCGRLMLERVAGRARLDWAAAAAAAPAHAARARLERPRRADRVLGRGAHAAPARAPSGGSRAGAARAAPRARGRAGLSARARRAGARAAAPLAARLPRRRRRSGGLRAALGP